MPVEGPTNDINGGFSAAEQEFSINFTKVKFSLSLHYNEDNSYLFVNGKKSIRLKPIGKNVYLPTHHFLWSIPGNLKNLKNVESEEVSFKKNVLIFLSIRMLLINLKFWIYINI